MTKIKGAALMLALLATAGCQSFPFNFAGNDQPAAATPDLSSYFAQRLHDGRRHLSAQRPGAAITAFRQASYHQDYAGEAYNGMAIAYDQIGRYDLAERFFAQAMQAAPEDERFARNSARFEATMLARREAASGVELAAAANALPEPESDSNFTRIAQALDAEVGTPAQGRLQRLSTGEVLIADRQDWTSRVVAAVDERPAVLHIGNRREGNAVMAEGAPEYPVRMALASVPVVRDESNGDGRGAQPPSRYVGPRGTTRVTVSGPVRRRVRSDYPVTVALDPSS